MPPVILDEFHGLGRIIEATLCNGSIERIPFLLQYGGLLVPIAPDDDGFRVGSCECGSFVIGEKPLELLLCPERNAIAPVKIAASALRILVKADLAPFLGGEITVERIAFPEFPQRHLGAEPDDSGPAGHAGYGYVRYDAPTYWPCPRPLASGGVHGRKAYSSAAVFRGCTALRFWNVAYC